MLVNGRLILASNSPRRREMLAWTGWSFAIQPADADETPLPVEQPVDYVLRLAVEKARTVAQAAGAEAVILAADTTVADGSELLGKPESAEDARRMLRQLRGCTHWVYSALALLDGRRDRLETTICTSPVRMRTYTDAEMEAYIASGDPFDKAGAYAIQHVGFAPVEDFDHCFANVMGLPLCSLVTLARRMGWMPPQDVPAACQQKLKFGCRVYSTILELD